MSKIIKNPKQFVPLPLPDVEIFLCGRGVVTFPWNFTRRDPFWFLYCNSGKGACLEFEDQTIRPEKKEIILILAPASSAGEIMNEVNREHGLKTEAKGIVCAVPVEHALKI